MPHFKNLKSLSKNKGYKKQFTENVGVDNDSYT